MILFLMLFILLSFISTIFKFSLISNKKLLYIAVALLPIFSLISYQLALQQNSKTFLNLIQSKNSASVLALIQISESILMIVFCLLLVKGFTKKRIKILAVPAQILMSFTSLGGIFFLQVYTFVHISGLNFGLLAGYFAAGITLITICSLWVVKAFFPSWELRVEFKIILAVVQIVLAMFLPIIVNKIKIPYSIITVDVLSISVLLVTVIFFSLIGAMLFFKRQAQSYD